MSKSVIIKKYKNRRLYDVESKSYTSLEKITQLIQEGDKVAVIDNDSQEDITQEVLLQIVLELNKQPQNLLPSDLLHQIIRRGEGFQESLRSHLGTSMGYFSKFKDNMSQQFQRWQEQWNTLLASPKNNEEEKATSSSKNGEELMHQIQAHLAEYEKKIQELELQFKEQVQEQFHHWNQLWDSLLPKVPRSEEGLEKKSSLSIDEEIFLHIQNKIAEYEEKIQALEAQLKSIAVLANPV